jgi:enediyne biosynthesis protein E3
LNAVLKQFRRRVFGIPEKAIDFKRRGFRAAPDDISHRLEDVCSSFVAGYHSALESGSVRELEFCLDQVEPERRGFAFEGAAMGLALLDLLTPWRRERIGEFLRGVGDPHAYMIHVGVGWVWARFPFGFRLQRKKLDPLLDWLAFDGWGFHEGFFHWPKYIASQPAPKKLSGYERRAFDQGLGRSFWFVNGGNIELIAQMIANFPSDRRPDLWSGIGLAATYAGMINETSLAELRAKSGSFSPQLAQGAAFAAKARQRAGNVTDYTNLATSVFCSMSALDAARLCDQTEENLPDNAEPPAFEVWRRRIQNHFAPSLQPQVLI